MLTAKIPSFCALWCHSEQRRAKAIIWVSVVKLKSKTTVRVRQRVFRAPFWVL